jgi:hypothetical protein
MTQTEFNLEAGREDRDLGMEIAASNKEWGIAIARREARRIALECGTVNINDVQRAISAYGVKLGNAAGSVFKGKEWERVGFGQADRVSSHARVISIWRLRA